MAGVAMAAGFILQYMAGGTALGRGAAAHPPGRWMGGGLLLAAVDRHGRLVVRRSFPHVVFPVCRVADRSGRSRWRARCLSTSASSSSSSAPRC